MNSLKLDAKICSQRTESKSQLFVSVPLAFSRWTPKYAVKELKANHNFLDVFSDCIAAGRQNMQSKN